MTLYSTNYINNSLHLARKYASIFVRGHYLFLEENSFPRAQLEENCELRGTDNVQGQISWHIFMPNGVHCVIILQLFFATCMVLKLGNILGYSPVLAGEYSVVICLEQSHVSKTI